MENEFLFPVKSVSTLYKKRVLCQNIGVIKRSERFALVARADVESRNAAMVDVARHIADAWRVDRGDFHG